jgi:YD repeat-containing protein
VTVVCIALVISIALIFAVLIFPTFARIVGAIVLALLLSLLVARVVYASEQHGMQTIHYTKDRDAALADMTTPTCVKSGWWVKVAEEQTVVRDSQGRTVGTATPQGDETVKFRDAQGRTIGSATTDPSGQTRYYDAQGRSLGTSTGPVQQGGKTR